MFYSPSLPPSHYTQGVVTSSLLEPAVFRPPWCLPEAGSVSGLSVSSETTILLGPLFCFVCQPSRRFPIVFIRTTGAGNLVVTGYTQASVRGATADFGTAIFSVGAGTITAVGTAQSSQHIARVRSVCGMMLCGGAGQAGSHSTRNSPTPTISRPHSYSIISQTSHVAGGYWFNGAGVVTIVGNARTNQGTSTNQHGIGLHICNVAGVTQMIGGSSWTVATARSQIAYGTDTFMAGTRPPFPPGDM